MADSSILLVSEDGDESELYATALPLYGFQVTSLTALEEVAPAVAAAARRPDALVMNQKLGSDHTWALLEQLQCGAALNLPGVLLTGSIRPDAANRVRARRLGCAAFVGKPCSPEALAAILRAVVAGRRGLVITLPVDTPPGTPPDGQPPHD